MGLPAGISGPKRQALKRYGLRLKRAALLLVSHGPG